MNCHEVAFFSPSFFTWDWGSGCLELALVTRLASNSEIYLLVSVSQVLGLKLRGITAQFEVAFSFEKKIFELVSLV